MASLDSVSIAILLGAVLVMAGILSSLLALRFGAPLLLVFLLIGMVAGDSGPGQLRFDDVRTTYLVGSVALALILFDGGLRTRFQSIRAVLAPSMVLGAIVGIIGGRLVVLALNRVALPQGLHAPFVATAALVVFGGAQIVHGSGFLAVYLAGIIIGNRPTRVHNSVVTFLDAATWLAQIVMFVLLGLLVSPQRLLGSIVPAVIVALVLMLVARPIAVFLCLAPFRFNWREKMFIAWTGLRGAVAIFLASIPMLVGLSKAYLYFEVAFVVVIILLLLQGWTLAAAARRLHVALPRADRGPRRVELDLPGQLEQQLVGYSVRPKSLFFRRGLVPSWSRPTLVIRDQHILSPAEADPIAPG